MIADLPDDFIGLSKKDNLSDFVPLTRIRANMKDVKKPLQDIKISDWRLQLTLFPPIAHLLSPRGRIERTYQ